MPLYQQMFVRMNQVSKAQEDIDLHNHVTQRPWFIPSCLIPNAKHTQTIRPGAVAVPWSDLPREFQVPQIYACIQFYRVTR